MSKSSTSSLTDKGKVNKYQLIGKYIDLVSFIVFGIAWVAVTVGFIVAVTAK